MRLARLPSARTKKKGRSAGMYPAPTVIHGEEGGVEWTVVVSGPTEGGGVVAPASCRERPLVEELPTSL